VAWRARARSRRVLADQRILPPPAPSALSRKVACPLEVGWAWRRCRKWCCPYPVLGSGDCGALWLTAESWCEGGSVLLHRQQILLCAGAQAGRRGLCGYGVGLDSPGTRSQHCEIGMVGRAGEALVSRHRF